MNTVVMDTATCVVHATFVSCGSFKKKDAHHDTPNSLIILSPIQGCHQLIQGTPFPSVRPLSIRRFSVINPKSPLMPTETLLDGQIDYDSVSTTAVAPCVPGTIELLVDSGDWLLGWPWPGMMPSMIRVVIH